MQEVNTVSLSGARVCDVNVYLRTMNLDQYWYVLMLAGGKDLSETLKGNRIRPERCPEDVQQEFVTIAEYLHLKGIRVFISG